MATDLASADELDRFIAPDLRMRLEERYWRPVEEAARAESFLTDEEFFADPGRHPAAFSDHGVVHVRDVARRAVGLAERLHGGLLPARSDDRLRTVQASAVLMAYLHDIGMAASTLAGRRVHAQYAAQTALGAGFDDLADELWAHDVTGLRDRIEADVVGNAGVAGPVVLRELLALSLGHSKSAVPGQLLDDPVALRTLMLRRTFTPLDVQMKEPNQAAWTTSLNDSSPATARYRDLDRDAFAWLVDDRPAVRDLVADVIDGIRVLRAADALRQRGTTQKTSAGYEVCVDRRTGRAVMAVRGSDNRFVAWMWLDSHHSIAEGNLRVVDLTADGSLRIAFHRGSFSGPGATELVVTSTVDTIADVEADALGSFAGVPGASRSARLVEVVPPPDNPEFATLVVEGIERQHPRLAGRTTLVEEPYRTPPIEAPEWYARAVEVMDGGPEVDGWFVQFSLHGLNVDAIDRRAALRNVMRVGVQAGEVVFSPHTAASVVVIPLGPGLRVVPTGGYRPRPLEPWLPVGSTGVVRGAERNAAVIAEAEIDLLAIPAERYLDDWFRPFAPDELRIAWKRWLATQAPGSR